MGELLKMSGMLPKQLAGREGGFGVIKVFTS